MVLQLESKMSFIQRVFKPRNSIGSDDTETDSHAYDSDMPTAHNSSIYEGSFPKIDAASIQILRQAGALIFGMTFTLIL
jgi:hypothetical protein